VVGHPGLEPGRRGRNRSHLGYLMGRCSAWRQREWKIDGSGGHLPLDKPLNRTWNRAVQMTAHRSGINPCSIPDRPRFSTAIAAAGDCIWSRGCGSPPRIAGSSVGSPAGSRRS
jgi:hypothetical protein